MSLKSLAKQTAIYGLSTIFIRFASWGLSPFYSRVILKEDLGTYSILMSDIAFINIIYMIGMETSFFRFANQYDDKKVYSTTNTIVFVNSCIWSLLFIALAGPLCNWLKIPGSEVYIYLLVATLFLENLCNIPFAKLRQENKPSQFALLKALNIGINIGLNFFFLLYLVPNKIDFIGLKISDPIIYIFLANLIPWILTFLYFSRDIVKNIHFGEWSLIKEIFKYSWPLIIVGLAGMTNEVIDRNMLDTMLQGTLAENRAQIAIYSVNFKLVIIMTLAIQAFRMGAEPYFFNQGKKNGSREVYANIMDFFIIACCMIMVATNLNRDLVASINESSYAIGIGIIPILILAKLFLGVYYNASIWFKLTDNTTKGAWLTVLGAIITIGVNYVLIPKIGYMGSAYATLACYSTMAVACILWGQKHFPIPYHFMYNSLWILGSVIYSFVVYQCFHQSRMSLIVYTLFFMGIATWLGYKRWLNLSQST